MTTETQAADTTATEAVEDFATFEARSTTPKTVADEGSEPIAKVEAEPEDVGNEPDGEGEAEPEAPAKAKNKIQERFDEMTAARREAERREVEARREAEYWRGQVAASKPAEPQAQTVIDPNAAPDPAHYDFGDVDPAYIEARVRHTVRQELEGRLQQQSVEQQLSEIERGWTEKLSAVAEKYPDYEEKLMAAADVMPCPEWMAITIKQSDVGPDIAYHLATHPDEAKKIASLHTIDQARALGRLEAKFLNESAQPKPPANISTNAPEPPSSRTRGAGGKFAVDDDTSNFSDFEAKYNKARGR